MAVVALTGQPLWADVITFRVVDAVTRQPIEGATYEVELRWDYGGAVSIGRQSGYETDSLGLGEMPFGTDCEHVTLKVECPGYYGAKRVFAITDGKDTLALGDIALRPSEVLLSEAVVKAKARRFTMHGDTVVFHPEAFQLEEGARLEDLLQKLPGVVLKDGELTWNGKPVRILVQGQESLSADLLRQLPAEALDKIKGYNKQSEAARKAERDDGEEDLVLDLQVKEGWLDKWYAGLEAQGLLPAHALAKLDALRLATKTQAMVFADWNNIGRRFGRNVTSSSESNYGLGTQTYGAGGWYNSWMMPRAKGEDKSTFTINAHLDHFDRSQWSETAIESFLSGEAFSRERRHRNDYSHAFLPNVSGQFVLRPDSAKTFTLDYSFSLSKTRTANDATLTRYDEADAAVSQQQSRETSQQQGGSGQVSALYQHFFADKSHLDFTANVFYDNYTREGSTARHIDYLSEGSSADYLQTLSRPSHQLRLTFRTSYDRWFGKNVLAGVTYQYRNHNGHSQQEMLANGVLDNANSYRRRDANQNHSLSLNATMNFQPFQLLPSLRVERNIERMDYRRGSLDTTATRTAWLLAPSVKTVYKIDKQNKLELNASYSMSQPDILKTVGYLNTSDPLNTSAGNPALRNSSSLNASLGYTANVVRRQRVATAGVSFSREYSPVQDLVAYNPLTAAYHTTFANVRGGSKLELRGSFDQGFGDHLRLRFQHLRASFAKRYAYLTDTGEGFRLNSQRRHGFGGGTVLSYERETWELALKGNLEYTGQRNSLADNYDLYDYSFGLFALWKLGHFELMTDFTDEAHRGYTGSGYNRNRLQWNASVTWKCLKGRGRVAFEAQDILNQGSPHYAEVSANSREEYRWEFFHRYVALSFSYRFEPKGH